jgi:LPS-assembly protein
VRYDLDQHRVNQTIIGAGYVDDCFIIAMNYITDYAYSGNPVADRRIMLQIGLRTLGVTSTTQNVGQASIQP